MSYKHQIKSMVEAYWIASYEKPLQFNTIRSTSEVLYISSLDWVHYKDIEEADLIGFTD
jgi:hypothetical protein